ncbi:MAG: TonB-dependent receptor [Steroidobacteraceae bacterium]|jgi:iron complex outermembrane receptor protein|nr:TonB-dependent receptor [Steroidobacteraceae bacterium]
MNVALNDAVRQRLGITAGRLDLKTSLLLGAIGAMASHGGFAAEQAQSEQESFTLERVVVTARKQEESLQDAPIAISAITGEGLREAQVSNLVDVEGSMPNVNFGARLSAGVPTIRGVGFTILAAGTSSNVAMHVDGVYVGRPAATAASFFDIERIEVVRGPQGTLYGRNATGGAINLITGQPTVEPDGFIDVTVGNYNSRRLEGAVGGAILGERLLGRAAFVIDQHDGWARNRLSGEEVDALDMNAFRGKLTFLASDAWTVDLGGEVFHQNDTMNGMKFIGQPEGVAPLFGVVRGGQAYPTNTRDILGEFEPVNELDLASVNATVTWTGDAYGFKSITGYRETDLYWQTDIDGTSLPIFNLTREEDARQFSQEFQLSYRGERLEWIAGLYYFDETDSINARAPGGYAVTPELVLAFHQSATVKDEAYGIFAEGTWRFNDHWAATLGMRYSDETVEIFDEQTVRPPLPTVTRDCDVLLCSLEVDNFSPRFILTYTPREDRMIYANVSKGFKSGGFSVGSVQPSYGEEDILSYELGAKTQWLNGRLQINAAAFVYDYTDMHQTKVLPGVTVTENASDATIEGLEIELQALLTPRLSLNFALGLLNAEFDEFESQNPIYPGTPVQDLAGNKLPVAPEYNGSLGAAYAWDLPGGQLTLRGEWLFSDEFYMTAFNEFPAYQKSYSVGNAFLTYKSDSGMSVGAFVRNMTDELVKNSGYISNSTGATGLGTYAPPRTYGVTVGYRF